MIFITSLPWENGEDPYPLLLLFLFENGYFSTSQNKYVKDSDILDLRTMSVLTEETYATAGLVNEDYSLIWSSPEVI